MAKFSKEQKLKNGWIRKLQGKIKMKNKENLLSIGLILVFITLISSCIYTLYQNKPEGHIFKIEKIVRDLL